MDRDWDLSAVVRSSSSTASPRFPPNSADPVANFRNTQKAPAVEEAPLACLASLTFEGDQDSYGLLRYPDMSQPEKYGSLFQSCNQLLSSTTGNSGTDCLSDLVNPPPPATSVPGVSVHGGQLCVDLPHAVTSGIGPPPPNSPSPPVVFFYQQPSLRQQKPKPLVHPLNRFLPDPCPILSRLAHPHPPRSKKRKIQQKRTVTQVTAEQLSSSDQWAWRKYGQKPIKGSPYPRNYYRCSSSKGCSARKQIEQSISDADMYTVTYTGEHTHPRPNYRNSLAGSTRNRVGSAQRLVAEATEGSCSSRLSVTRPVAGACEASSSQFAELEELLVEEEMEEAVAAEEIVEVAGSEEDDKDLLIPNLRIDDDLFKGLEEFTGGGGFGQSPSFGDNFSAPGDGNGSSPAGGAAAGSG